MDRFRFLPSLLPCLALLFLCLAAPASSQSPGVHGYYRQPALRGDTLVFTAHGDLWKVGLQGGAAQSLTSHPGEESSPAISPDGSMVAFSGTYEGPREVYVMPLAGGLPKRLTFGGGDVKGWTPDGRVLFASGAHSTLPNTQLFAIDPATRARTAIPLSQASDGCYDPAGTLYFTRQAQQGSHTKRYQGGTAQGLWKYVPGAAEAVPLTRDYAGTSKDPMWWNGRVYFLTDRDGTMNLWSMSPDGSELKQITHEQEWDLRSASLDRGRVAYQLGADLHVLDLGSGKDRKLDITLVSDMDQERERWVRDPMEYLTAAHLSPDGERVALTARGQVFVAPAKQGRFVEVTHQPKVRYRDASFAPDGKSLVALSDQTGEAEWWRLPANGVGAETELSSGSKVLQTSGALSPDGKRLAYGDRNQDLWLMDLETKQRERIAHSDYGGYGDLAWSPDSAWLAYGQETETFTQLVLYSVKDRKSTALTSDRLDNYNPAWSPDGKWLYFLSNRTFHSLVGSPWGSRQPEPFFDRQTRIYALALRTGLRSPFAPEDELHRNESPEPPKPAPVKPDEKKPEEQKTQPGQAEPAKPEAASPPLKSAPRTPEPLRIDLDGLPRRIWTVPVPPGNYQNLAVTDHRLFWVSRETAEPKRHLMVMDVTNKDPEVKTLVPDVVGFELSLDLKKIVFRKGNELHVLDTTAGAPASLDKSRVDLSGWSFSLDPRDEWRQMFVEAWRLERDYFYDPQLHGLDWPAVLKQYLPLVDRVTDRAELSDLLAQMVSELSALHMFVYGGDIRSGQDRVSPASLGAELARDEAAKGYRITRIYGGDPEYPDRLSPLARPGVDVHEGDVIEAINGVELMSVPDPGVLLRNQAGKEVLLHVRAKDGAAHDEIVDAITEGQAADLRYADWEYSRRLLVEKEGQDQIGYVHLRAMGSGDVAQWAREFYPVFNRQGLIVDVRHNGGGNIDSWILEKLLRKAWFYWQGRVGKPTWNMQWAFRGHVVVLCDEWTASDGEAFTEGVKRLGVGKVIGTRTWGGEIWLSGDNGLVDNGIATAAESGVYGPEGAWLIEGHGVDPDIVVDNLPHAAFEGKDAQLQAGIEYLQREIREHPVPVPPPPKYPIKRLAPRPGVVAAPAQGK